MKGKNRAQDRRRAVGITLNKDNSKSEKVNPSGKIEESLLNEQRDGE